MQICYGISLNKIKKNLLTEIVTNIPLIMFYWWINDMASGDKLGTPGVKWLYRFLKYLHPWGPVLCLIHSEDGFNEIN